MEFTQQDRDTLYQVWMSQKAKMRLTQMEMSKRLGMTQREFSELLRGTSTLRMGFVSQFCHQLHVDPKVIIPSLMNTSTETPKVVYLKSKMMIDGEIQRAYIEGNQVVVEYAHTIV